MAKTWRQKLAGAGPAHVEVLDKACWGLPIGARLFIATPVMIQERLEAIPCGQTQAVEALRAELATTHGADGTCPLTTGIFLRIVAEVALEELAEGADIAEVAPFWRVIDPKSPLAKKLSCGPDWIRAQRAAEQS